ncbi:energy transducer TonB [Methylococcus sp. ANG]|uniref:energy transducer TonB n=1 Tax=unclassified Methylococcus TaxID=2618889 RepID=UPI001C53074F|nr:energy transducer TonB [Methylococcus sp. Mc7]QXP82622.1 energy transducer TonB [Methylococcus sp. Mc7]
MNAAGLSAPLRAFRALSGRCVGALVVNLALLLLIAALVRRQDFIGESEPQPVPVDFVRLPPKPAESRPPPPQTRKTGIEPPTESRPSDARSDSAKSSTPSAQRLSRSKESPGSKRETKTPGVAAPRLDIPARGTGAEFPAVPGGDSRLTAPPAQWNPGKKPAGAGDLDRGAEGEGGAGNNPLTVIFRVVPKYPAAARRRGIEGWVRLEVTVTATGLLGDARVVDASPRHTFDEAALEAIRHWRFKPAFKDGRAVEQRAMLTMEFRLMRR